MNEEIKEKAYNQLMDSLHQKNKRIGELEALVRECKEALDIAEPVMHSYCGPSRLALFNEVLHDIKEAGL